jgi:hypothetical protein
VNGFKVKCADCDVSVEHYCHNQNLRKAVTDLLSWVPQERGFQTEDLTEAAMDAGIEAGWVEAGDDPRKRFSRPFFGSQAYSYTLFSKDSARTFHALIHNVCRAAGIDPEEIMTKIHNEIDAREKQAEDVLAARAQRKKERADIVAFMQGDAPLEERVAQLDKIIADCVRRHKLIPNATAEEHRVDRGFSYVVKHLRDYWGGGISEKLNGERILMAENAALMAQQEAGSR